MTEKIDLEKLGSLVSELGQRFRYDKGNLKTNKASYETSSTLSGGSSDLQS